MTWQVASFRGVKFRSQVSEITVGQRRGIYEFPFDSKGAASFDLGRRARKYSVKALIYPADQANGQNDYQRLLDAIEAPGPGMFVHPTRGPVLVVVAPEIVLTEDHEDMLDGEPITRFQFIATESRERSNVPTPTVDARSAVYASTVNVRAAASAAMVEGTRLEGVADFIRTSHLTVLDNVINDIALLNGTISAALAVPGTFASQIESISKQIVDLINTPDVLFQAFDGALTMIIQSINRVEDAGENAFVRDVTGPTAVDAALATLRLTAGRAGTIGSASVANEGAGTGPAQPPTSAIEKANKNVTLRGVRSSALSAAAEAAIDATYSSHQEALDVLSALTFQIDRLSEKPMDGQECPDGLFDTLQDLRAALTNGLHALELVDLVDYIPGETSDAAVIAYTLYGDADRADEVTGRSGVAHPGFIAGGKAIRVLER